MSIRCEHYAKCILLGVDGIITHLQCLISDSHLYLHLSSFFKILNLFRIITALKQFKVSKSAGQFLLFVKIMGEQCVH